MEKNNNSLNKFTLLDESTLVNNNAVLANINKLVFPYVPSVFDDIYRPKLNTGSILPTKPFYLVPSHFEIQKELDIIKEKINKYLSSIDELVNEFNARGHFWDCYFIHGSIRSHIEVRLYCNGNDKTIIECNRLSGDSYLFWEIYKEICKIFENDEYIPNSNILQKTSVDETITDEDAYTQIMQIFKIIREKSIDSKLIGMEILSDLISHNNIQEQLYVSGYISDLLTHFIQYRDNTICYLSIFILTILSKNEVYKDVIMNAHFLNLLLDFTVDGPFHNSIFRRKCAECMYNLTNGKAYHILNLINRERLNNWISSVDSIVDEKLKTYAINIRQFFMEEIEKILSDVIPD